MDETQLSATLYEELRRIAARHLRSELPDHTLQPTALVNEAWVRLYGHGGGEGFVDRTHFLALASRVMRRILVDHARARAAGRRGGDAKRVSMETEIGFVEDGVESRVELLDLDRALEAMEIENAALAKVIELNYFGGLTAEEIAADVGRTVHVVRHEIRFAQAWLRRELAR
jgi:RNA polymerase sigma factor (TIGR02999 family)